MATRTETLLRCVRRIATQAGEELSDAQLLARYLGDGDPAAFAALVTRHGPMVLRVCQHILGNSHDAEDAFQATFLVLARKASSVRPTGSLAGWLHGVASRVALGARTTARRQGVALPLDGAPQDPRPDPLAELTAREALCILEEEVQRLPEVYRLPVTLCCLHGLTQEEAAQQLGCTPGSVKGNLERGRLRLQRRLAGRGLGLTPVLALVEVSRATAAGPAAKLVASTALSAVAAASGSTAGLVSSEVLSLARSGLAHFTLTRGKLGLLLLLTVAFTAGLAALGQRGPDPTVDDQDMPANAAFPKRNQPRLDLHGDPLPEGALARLGTVRMRHGYGITGAVYSRDGKSIIASDSFSGIHVWDVGEGKEVGQVFRGDYYSRALALSPDGRVLAVAFGNLIVRFCDPMSDREFGSLPQDVDQPSNMVFSGDGSLLAIGNSRQSVCVWEVATRRRVHEVTFPHNVAKVTFSSDGKLIACGFWDEGICRLWDLAQGKEIRQLRNEPDGKDPLFALFAPGGGPLAVWGYPDRSIRLFDASGKEIRRFADEGPANRKPTSSSCWAGSMAVSFSPSGKVLGAFREAGQIELWDVASGEKLHTLPCDRSHKPRFLVFSPDGTQLASTGTSLWAGDTIIHVWDVLQGKEIRPRNGHSAPISAVALSPDGKTVATAGEDGILHLWERSSGKHLVRLEGYPDRRPHVAFSSDGQRVIWCGSYDGDENLRILDSRTGQVVSRLEVQGREKFWTALSDNGKTALSIDEKGRSLRFHDLTTGKVTREDATGNSYPPLVLSPTGDRTISSEGSVKNVADSSDLLNVGRLGWPTPSAQFSADGRRLVAAVVWNSAWDLRSGPPADEIVVIDPIAGKELRRFGKRDVKYPSIDAVALTRDGKMIVSAETSGDSPNEQIITLWETETGKERGHFVGPRGRSQALAFSADGAFVVSGGTDTSALVWDATRPRTRSPALLPRSALDIPAHFKNLASMDAEQAYVSICALRNTPQRTVAFLGDQSSLFARTDVQVIQRWIGDLDSYEFTDRDRASQELVRILDEAEAHLKKALQSKPSAEARRQIDHLLEERSQGLTRKELRGLRVIEILEHIATPRAASDATRLAAIALLRKLAVGAPESTPTQEARASLARLE
jgi:RNA polymerase sigma factor (sigma-70 family)